MINVRNIYIGLMWLAGVALGAAVVARPELAVLALPPLGILLIVSLIIDVTAIAVSASRGEAPMSMNARLIGFFGAAAIYLAITAAANVSPGG